MASSEVVMFIVLVMSSGYLLNSFRVSSKKATVVNNKIRPTRSKQDLAKYTQKDMDTAVAMGARAMKRLTALGWMVYVDEATGKMTIGGEVGNIKISLYEVKYVNKEMVCVPKIGDARTPILVSKMPYAVVRKADRADQYGESYTEEG